MLPSTQPALLAVLELFLENLLESERFKVSFDFQSAENFLPLDVAPWVRHIVARQFVTFPSK